MLNLHEIQVLKNLASTSSVQKPLKADSIGDLIAWQLILFSGIDNVEVLFQSFDGFLSF